MKSTTGVKWFAVLLLAGVMTAGAQGPGGKKGGGQGGPGGQGQPPSPEEMAKRWMEKFDANKDSVLTQDELTAAIQARQDQRKQGASGGSQGGQGEKRHAKAGAAGQGGERQGPPPANEAAAKMIEKFSSDKKGVTEAELAKAIMDHRAHRTEQGGGAGGPPK